MEITLPAKRFDDWDLLVGSGARSSSKQSSFDAFANSSSSLSKKKTLPALVGAAVFASMCAQQYSYLQFDRATGIRRPLTGTAEVEELLAQSAPSLPALQRTIEELESKLNLTRSQLAQALRVERATLYQWFRGVEPRPKTIERLGELQKFASEWVGAGLGSARALWHMQLINKPESKALGELLTAERVDWDAVRELIREASADSGALQVAGFSGGPGFGPESSEAAEQRRREIYPGRFTDD